MVRIIECPEELESLLYSNVHYGYPKEVIKKFRHQYRIIEWCVSLQEMYEMTTLRLHKLSWNLKWIYAIDLTIGRRLEVKILSWPVIQIIRISNHYAL